MNAGLMLAEVCQTYGWTLNYVLEMPACQFFLMARQARYIRYRELCDLCDISFIPNSDSKYLGELKRIYSTIAKSQSPESEAIAVPSDIATQPTNKILTEEDKKIAHAELCDLFAAKKGLTRRGR